MNSQNYQNVKDKCKIRLNQSDKISAKDEKYHANFQVSGKYYNTYYYDNATLHFIKAYCPKKKYNASQ